MLLSHGTRDTNIHRRLYQIESHICWSNNPLMSSCINEYYIDTHANTMTISNPDGMGAIVLENMANKNTLATKIADYQQSDIILYVVDTHIITCILQNRNIHVVHIHDYASNACIDMLNSETITHLTFENVIPKYFISQLAKFKHLNNLRIMQPMHIREVADAISQTNITNLQLFPSYIDDDRLPMQLDKLFANNKLQSLTLGFTLPDSQYTPTDWISSIRTNKTITYLSLNFRHDMTSELIDSLATAIRFNNTIKELTILDFSLSVDEKIIDAISESTSIKCFSTYHVGDDIIGFTRLLGNSKLTAIDMWISERHMRTNTDVISDIIRDNFYITNLYGSDGYLSGECAEYFERNRRLQYSQTHKHLLEFALIFITQPFDPYVIKMLFDEWYEPEGSNFHCAKKIDVIYSIRQSIERLNK